MVPSTSCNALIVCYICVYAVLQVVFEPQTQPEASKLGARLRSEWVVCVRGQLRLRKDPNPKMATGQQQQQQHRSCISVYSRGFRAPLLLIPVFNICRWSTLAAAAACCFVCAVSCWQQLLQHHMWTASHLLVVCTQPLLLASMAHGVAVLCRCR
jgi:hypothetical protein